MMDERWRVKITPRYLSGDGFPRLGEATGVIHSSDPFLALEQLLEDLKVATFGGGACETPDEVTVYVFRDPEPAE